MTHHSSKSNINNSRISRSRRIGVSNRTSVYMVYVIRRIMIVAVLFSVSLMLLKSHIIGIASFFSLLILI